MRDDGRLSESRRGIDFSASMLRVWLFLGAVNGLIAVAAGAYGRHGPFDDYAREMFAIGAQYQLGHALALIAVAWLTSRPDSSRWLVTVAGAGFALGIVLFSGTLYWFGASGHLPIPGAAPVGGGLLMLGWLCLILHALVTLRSK